MSGTDYDSWIKSMNDKAQSYGFRGLDDMVNTFYTPEERRENPLSTSGHYGRMFATMDRIKDLQAKWQSAPEVYNWRDTLTFGLADGRTRKEICRDNLNRYLERVQSDFNMNDEQMKKLCKNLGVPVNEQGRLALNSDVDVNPISTDTRLTTAFNNPPETSGALPGAVQAVTRTGPSLALAN